MSPWGLCWNKPQEIGFVWLKVKKQSVRSRPRESLASGIRWLDLKDVTMTCSSPLRLHSTPMTLVPSSVLLVVTGAAQPSGHTFRVGQIQVRSRDLFQRCTLGQDRRESMMVGREGALRSGAWLSVSLATRRQQESQSRKLALKAADTIFLVDRAR